MRIRKRRVPLPLSSLCPVPLSSLSLSLSDPFFLSPSRPQLPPAPLPPPPPVQLQQPPPSAAPHDPINHRSHKPSDQPPTTPNLASIASLEKKLIDDEEEKPNSSRVFTTPAKIEGSTPLLHQSGSGTLNQGGAARRWCERPNPPFQLKKRKNQNNDGEGEGAEDIKNVGTVVYKSKNAPSPSSSSSRKRGRGSGVATVLEGSRCSRVNGRGWRCCQPTLVGYSLCEHHLGKGRLRSMTNVRNRHQTKRPKAPVLLESSQEMVKEEPKDEAIDIISVDDQKKAKKGMKLGVVKARSMSSLLGQGSINSNVDSCSSSATPTSASVEAVLPNNIEGHGQA